ncbi:MAG: TerD family protein [Lachnospiraceae bacterium]|nr:TerD family protein [Lachnospiraceae bacterium]
MIEIPMRSSPPLDCKSILQVNASVKNARNLTQINTDMGQSNGKPVQNTDNYQVTRNLTQNTENVIENTGNFIQNTGSVIQGADNFHGAGNIMQSTGYFTQDSGTLPAAADTEIAVPPLIHQIQKGQKVPLDPSGTVKHIHVCLGWNAINPQCDLDVSAFILGADGKVLGDDWFVFYGQEYSPDKSVHFSLSSHTDREFISVDLKRLNPTASKIVFVLTINDAFTHHLNFGMVKDAYLRILDADTRQELVSFQMTDYYPNVISMMIGEIYLHQGTWKCNAIGNGVAKDLAGLCQLYGVETV